MKIYLLFMLTVFCASCRNDGKPILPLLDADDFPRRSMETSCIIYA